MASAATTTAAAAPTVANSSSAAIFAVTTTTTAAAVTTTTTTATATAPMRAATGTTRATIKPAIARTTTEATIHPSPLATDIVASRKWPRPVDTFNSSASHRIPGSAGNVLHAPCLARSDLSGARIIAARIVAKPHDLTTAPSAIKRPFRPVKTDARIASGEPA